MTEPAERTQGAARRCGGEPLGDLATPGAGRDPETGRTVEAIQRRTLGVLMGTVGYSWLSLTAALPMLLILALVLAVPRLRTAITTSGTRPLV